jgi:glycosyltransferase involved in cell wall biosynthesis
VTSQASSAGSATGTPTRVHLIYPHGDHISTPDAIGRQLGQRLEARYEVVYHDWSDRDVIPPDPGDILLGHPHPDPNTVFRRSIQLEGWRRRIMMAPFNHADLRQVAFAGPLLLNCDLFLAITGPYWFGTLADSRCSHWRPKMIHLDLAIDRNDYPPLKASFGSPGKRQVVYVGHTYGYKNTPYLSQIAARVPEVEFTWIGSGTREIRGLTALGQVDFASLAGKALIAEFDFLLTVGKADANPTTILEAMAWGLIPVCTPTSGYQGIPSIPNVPLGDAATAAAVVRGLVSADESELLEMQTNNWRLLDERYTWDRFAAQVVAAIESTDSPSLLPASLGRRLEFAFCERTAPYGRAGRLVAKADRRWRRLRSAAVARIAGSPRQK